MIITGILLALLAGSLVSLQTIFNSKVNEHTGSWSTTTMVLFTGFIASFLISLLVEGTNTFSFQDMKPWYWLSGAIGVGVVFCLVQGLSDKNIFLFAYYLTFILGKRSISAICIYADIGCGPPCLSGVCTGS